MDYVYLCSFNIFKMKYFVIFLKAKIFCKKFKKFLSLLFLPFYTKTK